MMAGSVMVDSPHIHNLYMMLNLWYVRLFDSMNIGWILVQSGFDSQPERGTTFSIAYNAYLRLS